MELSKRATAIAESMTLAIDAKAKKMHSQGIAVIGFGAGEPDFDTPVYIRDAAKEALDAGYTRYTPAAGTLALRQAICDKLERDNGLHYEPKQIVVSNGAKHSLYNTFATLLNPGDEVIIPAPYWVSYPEQVKMCDGVPVFVETKEENGFLMDMGEIERAITPRTKAICLCNPCNPTGALYHRKALEEIARIAVAHDLFVVSDEIYEKLVYTDEPYVSIASLGQEIYDRTILINGASKAYAMTGWRIGYAAAPNAVAKVMSNLQSQATSAPNAVAQFATMVALQGPQDEVAYMTREFHARRDMLCQMIAAIPGLSCHIPEGAFYIMMNIHALFGRKYHGSVITDSMTFSDLLLEGVQVAVVPGIAFGADDFVRLSYATSKENIQEGMKRIAAFVNELE